MDELVTLNQRVVKIKFYLNQTAQNIIEIGKELTAAKNEVPHGQWQAWLQDNFSLSQSTAQRFMKCAERFGKSATLRDLNYGQMIQILALPEAETEKFIAEKAAEGKPVEDMTVKTLRDEVAKYKADYETEKAKVENLFADFEQVQKDNGRLQVKIDAADKLANQYHVERDILQKKLENQKPITIEPADYQQLKKARVELQNKIDYLQKQLNKKTVEVVTPADYDTTKKELAQLQKRYADISLSMEIAQKLDTISTLMKDVMTSQSENGIEDYAKAKPERFDDMCGYFADFLDFYDTGRKKK